MKTKHNKKNNMMKWIKSPTVHFFTVLLIIIVFFTFLIFNYFFNNKDSYRTYKSLLDDIATGYYDKGINTDNKKQVTIFKTLKGHLVAAKRISYHNVLVKKGEEKDRKLLKEDGKDRYLLKITKGRGIDQKIYYYYVIADEKSTKIEVMNIDSKKFYHPQTIVEENTDLVDPKTVSEETKAPPVKPRSDLEKLTDLIAYIRTVDNNIIPPEKKDILVNTLTEWTNDTNASSDTTSLLIFNIRASGLSDTSRAALTAMLNNTEIINNFDVIISDVTFVSNYSKLIYPMFKDPITYDKVDPVDNNNNKPYFNRSYFRYSYDDLDNGRYLHNLMLYNRPLNPADIDNSPGATADNKISTSLYLCSSIPESIVRKDSDVYRFSEFQIGINPNDIKLESNEKFLIFGPTSIKWTISRSYRNDYIYFIFIVKVNEKNNKLFDQLNTMNSTNLLKVISKGKKESYSSKYLPQVNKSFITNNFYHLHNDNGKKYKPFSHSDPNQQITSTYRIEPYTDYQ